MYTHIYIYTHVFELALAPSVGIPALEWELWATIVQVPTNPSTSWRRFQPRPSRFALSPDVSYIYIYLYIAKVLP